MLNSLDKNPVVIDSSYVNDLTRELDAIDSASSCDVFLYPKIDFLNFDADEVNNFINSVVNSLNNEYTSKNTSSESDSKDIMYNDIEGNTVAVLKLDFQNEKMKMEFFGDILPSQKYSTPKEVNDRLEEKARKEGWQTEYGGRNEFNGNIEIRYTDSEDKAMAAIISTPSGKIDTVVEYQYVNGKKSQMLHTSEFGQTMTIYGTNGEHVQLLSIDIDIDGNVSRIVKIFDDSLKLISGF